MLQLNSRKLSSLFKPEVSISVYFKHDDFQELGIANKRNKSKIIFGGQIESIILCLAPQRQLKKRICLETFFQINFVVGIGWMILNN